MVQIAAHYAKYTEDFSMTCKLSKCKNSNTQREGPSYTGHTEWIHSTNTEWLCVEQFKS